MCVCAHVLRTGEGVRADLRVVCVWVKVVAVHACKTTNWSA